MKKIICFALLMYSCKTFAQKQFEGKITYAITSIDDSTNNKTIIAYFKHNKMFLEHAGKTVYSDVNTLYDFQKAICYVFISDSAVTYSKILKNIFPYNNNETDSVQLKIAGYACYKKSSLILAPMNQYFNKVENWFASDLVFAANDSADFITPPLLFFNENHISLKTMMSIKMPETKNVTIEAIKVEAQDIPDSVFEIAAFKKVQSMEEYSKEIMQKFKTVDDDLNSDAQKVKTLQKPTKAKAILPKKKSTLKN